MGTSRRVLLEVDIVRAIFAARIVA
jgi:hypothetical protein